MGRLTFWHICQLPSQEVHLGTTRVPNLQRMAMDNTAKSIHMLHTTALATNNTVNTKSIGKRGTHLANLISNVKCSSTPVTLVAAFQTSTVLKLVLTNMIQKGSKFDIQLSMSTRTCTDGTCKAQEPCCQVCVTGWLATSLRQILNTCSQYLHTQLWTVKLASTRPQTVSESRNDSSWS